MDALDTMLLGRPPRVDRLELRRLVTTVRERVLGSRERLALGRYQLLGKIGEGGFGNVYRAFDPTARRSVAVKVLHRERETHEGRLRHEARTLASLNSQHVVRVLDFGRDQGRDFFVMEFIQGRSLQTWRPASLAEALRVFSDLLRGVEAIHGHGLVHCDLKPNNVCVDRQGNAIVIDFGLAASADFLLDPTSRVGGSPSYSAPEQFHPHPVDARADQYALGRIGLELLAGFPDSSRVRRHRTVLRRATALDPNERFANVAELRRELTREAPLATYVGAALVALLALILGIREMSGPTGVQPTAEAPAVDPLRRQLDAIQPILSGGDLKSAARAVDVIPRKYWRGAAPDSVADAASIQALGARARGEPDDAIAYQRIAVWTSVDAGDDEGTAEHAARLATFIALELSDGEQAEQMLDLAGAALERADATPTLRAEYWAAVADVERFVGSPARELHAAQQAIAELERTENGPGWRKLLLAAIASVDVGDLESARQWQTRMEAAHGGHPKGRVMAAMQRARLEWALGNPEASISAARLAVSVSTEFFGPADYDTNETKRALGIRLINQDPQEAVAVLEDVVDWYEDSTSTPALVARANLAQALSLLGRHDEGETMLLRVLNDFSASENAPDRHVASVWGMLGKLRQRVGKTELALDAYERALALVPDTAKTRTLRKDLEDSRSAVISSRGLASQGQ